MCYGPLSIYKRGVSLLLATIGLLLAAPADRIDCIGNKASLVSSPVIFRAEPIGLGGQAFTLFKFRNHDVDADRGGYARPVEHNDQRITKVGHVLRRLRLETIPQLLQHSFGGYVFRRTSSLCSKRALECASRDYRNAQRWTVRASYGLGSGAARVLCVASGQH